VEFLARAAPRLPPDLRATAMRLIAARGEARDVAALLSIADKTGSTDELAPALSALIARDASALDEMQGRLFRLEDPVLREVVRAVGNSSRSRAVGLLADLVGRSIDLDGAILGELGRLGAVAEPETARKAARRVRSLLDERNPGLARAAVNALARLGDPDPVGDLIELLASEDTGLARTAYAGLKQLTGLRLRESPGPWAAWHAEQVAWADAALDRTLDALLDAELAVVLEALRELQQHPLERHLIAEEVAGLLRRPEPELRRAAADALRCLGSRAPVEELVPLLDDEDPSTAAAARRALVALLGSEPGASPPTEADPETLPRSEPEQAAWLAVISGRR
jgi:HEAT repeat protein